MEVFTDSEDHLLHYLLFKKAAEYYINRDFIKLDCLTYSADVTLKERQEIAASYESHDGRPFVNIMVFMLLKLGG